MQSPENRNRRFGAPSFENCAGAQDATGKVKEHTIAQHSQGKA
jgi:hypothetical protein